MIWHERCRFRQQNLLKRVWKNIDRWVMWITADETTVNVYLYFKNSSLCESRNFFDRFENPPTHSIMTQIPNQWLSRSIYDTGGLILEKPTWASYRHWRVSVWRYQMLMFSGQVMVFGKVGSENRLVTLLCLPSKKHLVLVNISVVFVILICISIICLLR